MRAKKISTVLIVDDHAVVRTGVQFLLKRLNRPIEVSSSEHFSEALSLLKKRDFDLVILDVDIPGGDNIGMVDTIRFNRPGVPILIFTSYSEEIYGLPYLQAGANGFLSKTAPDEELFTALKAIENGQIYIGAALQKSMLVDLVSGKKPSLLSLSKREMDVANLLVKGLSTAEIGDKLNLQLSTVSTFKTRIYSKLKVSNLVELIAKMKIGSPLKA